MTTRNDVAGLDPDARRAAFASNVPNDIAASARDLLKLVDERRGPHGEVPPCLYRLHRSLTKFVAFADLADG